jgi:hypothetical protein
MMVDGRANIFLLSRYHDHEQLPPTAHHTHTPGEHDDTAHWEDNLTYFLNDN